MIAIQDEFFQFSLQSLAENDFFHLILSFFAICKDPVAIKVGQNQIRYKFVVEQCAKLVVPHNLERDPL